MSDNLEKRFETDIYIYISVVLWKAQFNAVYHTQYSYYQYCFGVLILEAVVYIYIYFFFAVSLRPNAGHGLLILEVFLDHTQRLTTVGRTPLDE